MLTVKEIRFIRVRNILSTVKHINLGHASPRVRASRLYGMIFGVLTYLLFQGCTVGTRAVIAGSTALVVYSILYWIGPGQKSWWQRLADQLWSYNPTDKAALEDLRETIRHSDIDNKRNVLLAIIQWANIELEHIQKLERA